MKLRNKKTGKIGRLAIYIQSDEKEKIRVLTIPYEEGSTLGEYSSLAELNEEWEDYKELVSDYWYIATEVECGLDIISSCDCSVCKKCRDFNDSIGNLFKTKEEAEKAVEKLKAWKRLKDKGFRFNDWNTYKGGTLGDYEIFAESKDITDVVRDLDFLFSQEDD